MFDKTISKIIPVRVKILLSRDKPARTPHNYSVAAGLQDVSARILYSNSFQVSPAPDQQLSVVASFSRTSQVLSIRNISDATQITLPVVQAAVAAIPAIGAPLASAIGALLAVIRAMDASIQNHEALGGLTHRLYTLCCHIANAPTARTQSEEAIRRALIKVLEDTTDELRKMRTRLSGSARLTQDIAGCFSRINDSLFEFMALSQMQLTELMHTQLTKTDYVCRAMMAMEGRLPAIMTVGCAVVVDATGEEHRMPLDQCCSFDRLLAFLPGILSQCRPDKADIQRWYIDRGQYDFVIDNGTSITQLTRESDIWSTIEPGTKIVMRVITTEVSRAVSASYQCRCGKWNEVQVDQGAMVDALQDGFIIT
ncbi:hypothetical protein EV401DRAFT_1142320 [Pisolithus croceorrhizus]|nr:hypothetical protein EV401DRAFT_1142320 [Pisolithus croceorrhizus]